MKNILILAFVICLMIACQNPSDKLTMESPVDSLVTIWEKNWNNHDSTAVINMYDPDVVLIDNNIVATNSEELLTKLIRPYINIMRNMRHEKIQEWATNDRAGVSGTWTVDINVQDTVFVQAKGAFTYIWKKTKDGEWKVTNAHISELTE
jgi:ketosteroid isomerase-like protein